MRFVSLLFFLNLAVYLLLAPTASTPPVRSGSLSFSSGWLSAYAIEPTIGTFNKQLYEGDIELGHDVYLATVDCGRIGETGTIIIGDSPPLDYQVFDCAGDGETVTWMTANNIIAEVDYWTWQRYGLGRATMTAGE